MRPVHGSVIQQPPENGSQALDRARERGRQGQPTLRVSGTETGTHRHHASGSPLSRTARPSRTGCQDAGQGPSPARGRGPPQARAADGPRTCRAPAPPRSCRSLHPGQLPSLALSRQLHRLLQASRERRPRPQRQQRSPGPQAAAALGDSGFMEELRRAAKAAASKQQQEAQAPKHPPIVWSQPKSPPPDSPGSQSPEEGMIQGSPGGALPAASAALLAAPAAARGRTPGGASVSRTPGGGWRWQGAHRCRDGRSRAGQLPAAPGAG